MPSNHLILCRPLLLLPSIFPSIRVFSKELALCISGQSIGASASVLPMNIQGRFPLKLTDLISLQSKGHSRVFSNTTIQKHQFFSTQPSLRSNSHIHTWLLEKLYRPLSDRAWNSVGFQWLTYEWVHQGTNTLRARMNTFRSQVTGTHLTLSWALTDTNDLRRGHLFSQPIFLLCDMRWLDFLRKSLSVFCQPQHWSPRTLTKSEKPSFLLGKFQSSRKVENLKSYPGVLPHQITASSLGTKGLDISCRFWRHLWEAKHSGCCYHGLPRWLRHKESACNAWNPGSISGQEDPLEKEMVTQSSILAWGIPWTEEPGGLQSIGSQSQTGRSD